MKSTTLLLNRAHHSWGGSTILESLIAGRLCTQQRPSTSFNHGCRYFMTTGQNPFSIAHRRTPGPVTRSSPSLPNIGFHRTLASNVDRTQWNRPGSQSISAQLKPLRPSEIVNVFGRLMDVRLGNELLNRLQTQRIDGTLDQDLNLPRITPDMVSRGLQYLRRKYPMDEDVAIMKRIEREEGIEEEIAEAQVQEAESWQPQDAAKSDGIYGKSKVEKMVKDYNDWKALNAEAQERYLQQQRENTEVVYEEELERVGREIQRKITEVHIVPIGNTKIRRVKSTSYAPLDKNAEQQIKELSAQSDEPGLVKAPGGQFALRRNNEKPAQEKWWHKYEKRAQLTNWDGTSEAPHMPVSQRWGLPTLFMLLTIGASVLFAEAYQPPSSGARLFPDIPPAAATIGALVSLNIVAWILWKVPPMWRFMNRNMILHAVIPRPIQLLGNTFSHHQFSHLAMNMLLLWWMGTQLCDQVGRGNFLALYIAGGVFASWFSLTTFLVTRQFLQASLGASGAICGVVSCHLWLNAGRDQTFPFFPGEWKPKFKPEHLLALLIAIELFGAFYYLRNFTGSFDHFSHLGGYLAGVAAAELLSRRSQAGKSPFRGGRYRA